MTFEVDDIVYYVDSTNYNRVYGKVTRVIENKVWALWQDWIPGIDRYTEDFCSKGFMPAPKVFLADDKLEEPYEDAEI